MDDMYLIALLRAAVNDAEPEKPEGDIDWRALYALAEKHSVTAAAWYAISKLPAECRPGGGIEAAFRKKMQMALGIESMQHYEISKVMETLAENEIRHAPLKGWILKGLYPAPFIRTMCDVDIIVDESVMPRIEGILEGIGFKKESSGENHDGYLKSGKVSTEIHWMLFDYESPYHDFFADIMDRTVAEDEYGFKRRLTGEDFFLHLVAHLAKHFNGSGTGLRSFMDIYVYTKKYADVLDRKYIEDGLDKLGLRKFAETVSDASYAWFSDDASRDREKYGELLNYVLFTGTYGNKDAYIAAGIEKNNGSKFSYLMGRFFPRRSLMECQFPILKKRPYLMPFYYVARGVKCIIYKRDVVSNEFKKLKRINDEDIKNLDEVKRSCGL